MERQKHVQNELILLLYEELDDTAAKSVRRHLSTCTGCRAYFEELQRLHRTTHALQTSVVDDDALLVLRRDLMRQIRKERPQESLIDRLLTVAGFGSGPVWRPVAVLSAVAAIAFLAGFLIVGGDAYVLPGLHQAAYDPYGGAPSSGLMSQDAQITNLRIIAQDQSSGDIEFEFEAVMPVYIKGNMHDPDVQAVLAKALVSSQNPGIRLRAANVIGERSQQNDFVDGTRKVIKESLISAVLYDENRGVRLEAMKALRDFLPDSAATSAILLVLKTETNVAMKIAAINSLDLAKFTEAPSRQLLLDALRERSVLDENNYIRIRATSALQEVQQ